MKLIGAIIALSLALAALYISQVAAGYACDEQVPCTSGSRPHVVRLLAGVGLAGVVALLVLAARHRARGALLVGMLTAAFYVVWLVLIVEQIEGSPPSVSFGSVSVPA